MENLIKTHLTDEKEIQKRIENKQDVFDRGYKTSKKLILMTLFQFI